MADGNITIITHANLSPKIWDPVVQREFVDTAIMQHLINYDTQGGRAGSTVKMNIIPRKTAQTKVAGVPFTPSNEAPTQVELEIDTHIGDMSRIDMAAQALIPYDLANTEGVSIAQAIARYFDAAILDIPTEGTHEVIDASTTPVGDALYKKILELRKAFNVDNIPADDRHLIISPDAELQFLQLEKLINRDYNSAMPFPAAMADQYMGQIAGFSVFWSNQVKSDGTNDLNMAYSKSHVLANVAGEFWLYADSVPHVARELSGSMLFGKKAPRDEAVKIFKTVNGGYTA